MYWKRDIGRYLVGSSVVALLAASGSSASAQTNEQLAAQLKAMQAQIEHLQRQIEENNNAAAAARAAAARSGAAQATAADAAAARAAAARSEAAKRLPPTPRRQREPLPAGAVARKRKMTSTSK